MFVSGLMPIAVGPPADGMIVIVLVESTATTMLENAAYAMLVTGLVATVTAVPAPGGFSVVNEWFVPLMTVIAPEPAWLTANALFATGLIATATGVPEMSMHGC